MLYSVFIAMAIIVFIGSMITYMFADIQVDSLRLNINKLVLYIFLPALNFNVLYQAQIGHEMWQLPVLAISGILISILLSTLIYRFMHIESASKGALILACAFGNVTYFGIAVLQGLYSQHIIEVTKVVVLFEISLAPFNLLIGALIAGFFNLKVNYSIKNSLLSLFKMPLLWSGLIAIIFNVAKVPMPGFVLKTTDLLANAVSGLMILSLGMSLKYQTLFKALKRINILLPVLLIKLIISPIIMLFGVRYMHVGYPYSAAAIIEASMPTQLITLVVADRYKFDVEILAVVIALDTIISFFTIPLIYSFIR